MVRRPATRTIPAGPPGCPRLAAETAALKDASRRAIARWPRKNEAILDRGGPHCLGMFRPGRENATPAEPENVVCARRLTDAWTNTNGKHLYAVTPGHGCRLRWPCTEGRIWVCPIYVSQGWGSVHSSHGHGTFVPLVCFVPFVINGTVQTHGHPLRDYFLKESG